MWAQVASAESLCPGREPHLWQEEGSSWELGLPFVPELRLQGWGRGVSGVQASGWVGTLFTQGSAERMRQQ